MEEPGGLQSMGSLRVGHDWATSLSLFTFMHWRGKWQPTPVFLPGEAQGQGILVGCCLWGRTDGYDWRDLATAAPPTPKGEEWILGSRDPWEPVLTATCYHLTFQPSQTTQLLQTSLKIIKKLVVNLLSNFKWLNSLEFWKLDSLIAQLVHVDVWQNQYNIIK